MNITHQFTIAKRDDVRKRVEALSRRSEDIKARVAETLKKLWLPERELAAIHYSSLETLRVKFPNFHEVLDIVEASIIGLAKSQLSFEMNPLLLSGDPGLGKTFFVSELAKHLGLPFYELSMATLSAGFGLSGLNLQWGEGSVGFIASSLADSSVANPIFLLDEIDKATGSEKFNAIAPFYSLLETHTAKRFKDEALEIEMDASRIIWIATANYPDLIPPPILSRMRVLEIKRPSPQDMHEVIASIYCGFRMSKAYAAFLSPELPTQTVECLSRVTPREAKLAIEEAGLKAILKHREILLPEDLPRSGKEKQRVGFI